MPHFAELTRKPNAIPQRKNLAPPAATPQDDLQTLLNARPTVQQLRVMQAALSNRHVVLQRSGMGGKTPWAALAASMPATVPQRAQTAAEQAAHAAAAATAVATSAEAIAATAIVAAADQQFALWDVAPTGTKKDAAAPSLYNTGKGGPGNSPANDSVSLRTCEYFVAHPPSNWTVKELRMHEPGKAAINLQRKSTNGLHWFNYHIHRTNH